MFQWLALKRTRIPRAENQSLSNAPFSLTNMDVLANYSIFQELQLVHDTGYFSAMPSLEENWQQVNCFYLCLCNLSNFFRVSVRSCMCAQLTQTRQTIFNAFCIIATLRTVSLVLHMLFKIAYHVVEIICCFHAYFLRPNAM